MIVHCTCFDIHFLLFSQELHSRTIKLTIVVIDVGSCMFSL